MANSKLHAKIPRWLRKGGAGWGREEIVDRSRAGMTEEARTWEFYLAKEG